MPPRSLIFFLFILIGTSGHIVTTAEAQIGFRRDRVFDTLQRQDQRQRYRPNAHISRGPTGSRTFSSGASIPFEYHVRQGFVSKIEIRSGLKVIKTIYVTPSSAGRGRFTLTAADFAKAGKTSGKLKFKLWGWQGRSGWQSVHGESISYTLNP